jgi:hypothetical protein
MVAVSTFGGRIERMGRWRRGARQVSLAELRELLRADQDELAAALDRRSWAHRVTQRGGARQRYLAWLQRQLQTGVPPAVDVRGAERPHCGLEAAARRVGDKPQTRERNSRPLT